MQTASGALGTRASVVAIAFGVQVQANSIRMLTGVSTLLFDWDGTLVDSALSSYLTFQKALAHIGIPFTWEQFEAHFTTDWHRMYEAVGVSAAQFDDVDAAWKRSYPCVSYQAVEGTQDTLATLRRRGYR